MESRSTNTNISLFLIFAFGLPAVCLSLTQFSIFQTEMPRFILYGIQAMTPALSALLVVVLTGGRGLRIFLKKCYMDNISSGYILLAFLLPLAVLAVTKLTAVIILKQTAFITAVSAKKLVIVIWALFAEEIGWRGFLQKELDKRFSYLVTPLLTGVVWAFWHYHLFLSGNMSAPLVLFLLGCVADSYGYYWVTAKSKGNVIPASIWHFTSNLFFNLFTINADYNNGSIIPYMLFVFYSIVMAICITLRGFSTQKEKYISLRN